MRGVIAQSDFSRVYFALGPDGVAVALKELAFVLAPDVKQIDLFEREARALRAIEDPQVPRFIASFREGEGVATRLYLAQEFVDGESLQARLDAHRWSETEVEDIAFQVLGTLVRLHARTPMMLHRDIKPANLIMRPDRRVVLVDFGTAREVAQGIKGGTSYVGTFGYMAPEQLFGMVDASSDLYALGATLAHLLARVPPAQMLGPDLRIEFRRHVEVSPRMQRFLDLLLAPNCVDRFKTAADALAVLTSAESIDPAPTTRRRLWSFLPLAGLAVVGVGVFALQVRTSERAGAGAAIQKESIRAVSSRQDRDLVIPADVSIDTRFLVPTSKTGDALVYGHVNIDAISWRAGAPGEPDLISLTARFSKPHPEAGAYHFFPQDWFALIDDSTWQETGQFVSVMAWTKAAARLYADAGEEFSVDVQGNLAIPGTSVRLRVGPFDDRSSGEFLVDRQRRSVTRVPPLPSPGFHLADPVVTIPVGVSVPGRFGRDCTLFSRMSLDSITLRSELTRAECLKLFPREPDICFGALGLRVLTLAGSVSAPAPGCVGGGASLTESLQLVNDTGDPQGRLDHRATLSDLRGDPASGRVAFEVSGQVERHAAKVTLRIGPRGLNLGLFLVDFERRTVSAVGTPASAIGANISLRSRFFWRDRSCHIEYRRLRIDSILWSARSGADKDGTLALAANWSEPELGCDGSESFQEPWLRIVDEEGGIHVLDGAPAPELRIRYKPAAADQSGQAINRNLSKMIEPIERSFSVSTTVRLAARTTQVRLLIGQPAKLDGAFLVDLLKGTVSPLAERR